MAVFWVRRQILEFPFKRKLKDQTWNDFLRIISWLKDSLRTAGTYLKKQTFQWREGWQCFFCFLMNSLTSSSFSYTSAQENFLLPPGNVVRASGVNWESTSPVRLPLLQGGPLSSGRLCHRPHTQSLPAFPPFSPSFARTGMGIGEEVKKGNYPNIGNWKYFKK